MENRGKVMVVDDDLITLKLTRARLESAGFHVVTRQSALGTSAALLSEKPDVLLADVNMPGLSGDKIARLARSSGSGALVSVILHSGMDGCDLDALAQDCGAIGVIPKTSSDRVFLAQFERLFELAQIAREEADSGSAARPGSKAR